MNNGPTPQANRATALWQLILTRNREFLREPAAVFWVYVFPLLMTFTLGLAFRAEPTESYFVTVVDSPQGKAAVAKLEADEEKRFQVELLDYETARNRLRTGKTELVLIPNDADSATDSDEANSKSDNENRAASSALAKGIDGLTFWFDPRNSKSDLAHKAVNDFLQRQEGREDVFETNHRVMDEPGGRYIDFLIPGLICMNLMGSGLWGMGFAIVDLRIRGLMKRFVATPMRRSDFLIAAMVSRLFFLIPELLLVIVFARFVFDVYIFGNLFLVIFLILLGSVQFAGIGLMIASRARTMESISGLMNLVMLPNWILAGIFFDSSNFPAMFQWIVQSLPLTPLVNALRSVMIEGAGVAEIWPELLLITAWTVISYLIAMRLFKWQ